MTSNLWLGCNETKCFPLRCPRRHFHQSLVDNRACPEFMFKIDLLSDEKRVIQNGDSIILKVENITSGVYMPLNCIPSEDHCVLNTSISCHTLTNESSADNQNCTQQTFKVVVAGEREPHSLGHSDLLVLQDNAAPSLSMDCNTRRKHKNCSLQACTSFSCLHFTAFKLETGHSVN